MDFYKVYSYDKTAFEDGTWVALPQGIRLKVRSIQSAHSKLTRKKLEEPYLPQIKAGRELGEEVNKAMAEKQFAESLIVDWNFTEEVEVDGVKTERKKEPTPGNILKAIKDLPWLLDDASAAVASRDTFMRLTREEDLGN